MKVIAFLTEYAVVDRIIRHLELTFAAEKPPPYLRQCLAHGLPLKGVSVHVQPLGFLAWVSLTEPSLAVLSIRKLWRRTFGWLLDFKTFLRQETWRRKDLLVIRYFRVFSITHISKLRFVSFKFR